MKTRTMFARWMRSSSALKIIAFVVALLLMGVLSFETGTPVAHAGLTILVDRLDDPLPVPSTCSAITPNDCSLRGAIAFANSNPGTTINLTYGNVYTLSDPAGYLNITADTTIFPTGSCSLFCYATIQGTSGWADRILKVGSGANVQITQVIIKNGNVTGEGGGIENFGNLTLNTVTVRNNTSTDDGGGIWNSHNLTITNGSIVSNTVSSTSSGGGGLSNDLGTVTISDSQFAYNSAGGGGGIISNGGVLGLTNTTVLTNTATTHEGGGVDLAGAVTITDGSISGNTAHGGGGLYLSGGGTANISGTVISGNHANATSGGGVFCSTGTTTLTNATVNNNTAITYGGGVSVQDGCNLNMSGTTVDGNKTAEKGGGLYFDTTSSTISSSTISNNTMTLGGGSGGGIYLTAGTLAMSGSTIVSNTLPGTLSAGGGIYSDSGTNLAVTTSAIISNTSYFGGGMLINGTATIANTTISGNTAVQRTGGIEGYLGATLSFNNVTISNNQSATRGGVAAVGITANVKNSLIAGNTASSEGRDCYGTLTSQGYNLLGNPLDCNGLINGVNGDLVGTSLAPLDPKLGPLTNNGGSTLTHALLFGSPAINAGNPGIPDGTGNHCEITDQRGVARSLHLPCDIGAFEYNYLRLYLPLIMR